MAYCDTARSTVALELDELFPRIRFIEVRGETSESWIFGTKPEARIGISIAPRRYIVREVDVLKAVPTQKTYGTLSDEAYSQIR